MRSLPILAAALLALLVPAASAGAGTVRPVKGKVQATVGIADQQATVFTDPLFTRLGMRHARRSVAWDALRHGWQVADVDAWMHAARSAGISPVITFARSRIAARRHLVPTPAQMRASFVAFRARYPWVRDFVASNESNHFGEPTGRRPKLAARYYRAMRSACPRCRIAAATLLDQPNLVPWTRAFMRAARVRPKLWAMHNYVSANRFETRRTRRFLRITRGQIWLTEVGGLVRRRTPDAPGKVRLPEGTRHAAKVTSFVLDRLARLSPRITRVYLYHFRSGGPGETWDSGLVGADGRPRPAYTVLSRWLEGRRAGGRPFRARPARR